MPQQLQVVRVVLVSPGDVTGERVAAEAAINEVNRGVARDRSSVLLLWRWETDARPGLHPRGQQGLIDDLMEIPDADIVIGVFWKRFGTPTGAARSGTEHELERAWASWQQHGHPDVMLYFCNRPYAPRSIDDLAQWTRVLEFKNALPPEQGRWEYETVADFEAILRQHLAQFLLSRKPPPGPTATAAREPSASAEDASNRLDAARGAYLRWMLHTHADAEAAIAGRRVSAPLAEMPWSGAVDTDDSNQHIRQLEVAYLRSRTADMNRESTGLEPERLAARPLPTYLASAGHVDRVPLTTLGSRPAENLLDTVWRALLLGDPGSGKTTIARKLSLREAERAVEQTALHWRLPVTCRAADLMVSLARDGGAPGDRHVIATNAITAGWNSTPPADPLSGDRISPADLTSLVIKAAEEQRLLLVIDGLDEVPTRAQRDSLVNAIDELVARDGHRYGLPPDSRGNQLLVTSRLLGNYATPLTESVHQLILQPMDVDAALATGEFWLRHFGAVAGQGPAATRAMQERLRGALTGGDASAASLASNPYLLVSLISAIASGELDRRRSPRTKVTRSDLYECMVDDALDRARLRIPGAPRELLLRLQSAVAYVMHRTSRTGVLDPAGLQRCVGDALGALGPERTCSTQVAIDYLRILGLVTARGQDLVGFLHLTLEEYLAGRWLVADGSAAQRIQSHLDDPRWVEAIRLGLGHLSKAAPERFVDLLDTLLSGPGNQHAAALLAVGIDEFDAVLPRHIAAAVDSVVAADVRHVTGGDRPPGAADAMTSLLCSSIVLPGGARPADVVSATLARIIRTESMLTVTAAARAVETVGVFDRQVAEALFVAQESDSSEYGWATVSALHAIAGAGGRHVPTDAHADQTAPLTDEDRRLLATLTVTRDPSPRGSSVGRAPLPRSLTPFRSALDGPTLERIRLAPAPLLRMVLCLYDGVCFRDTRRWSAERARLESELALSSSVTEVRRRAAVRLDTAVASALGKPVSGRIPRPDHIVVDSPLTSRILEWLRAGASVGSIARGLGAIADDATLTDKARGDAVAGLIALGPTDEVGLDRYTPDQLDDGVRRRLTWRMDRARFVLGDAATVDIGRVVDAFQRSGATASDLPELSLVLTRSLRVLRETAPTWGDHVSGLVRERVIAVACSWTPSDVEDRAYELAVLFDARGADIVRDGALSIARTLANAHVIAAAFEPYVEGWSLDSLAPRDGNAAAEALTALDGLAPRLAFVRCWFLDRMADLLTERGYAVEAICLALSSYADDRISATRTIRRFAGLIEDLAEYATEDADPRDSPGFVGALDRLADGISDAYARSRARLRVSRLRGVTLDVPTLLAAAHAIDESADRVRLLELAVSLGLTRWEPEISESALACVVAGPPSMDSFLASARLARDCDPGGFPALRKELADMQSRLPSANAGLPLALGADDELLAPPLLRQESLLANGETRDDGTDSWAVVTAAAMSSDALAALRSRVPGELSDEDALWQAVSDPERREEAARVLCRRGEGRMLELSAGRCVAVSALLAQGAHDTAAELLAVSRVRRLVPEVERWRACESQRVADLAALLVIEAGRMDRPGIAALPRLLADRAARVRLRAALATSTISRGSSRRPRFTATAIGPAALADLVTASTDARTAGARFSTDLWCAVVDVVHDSIATLAEALALLEAPATRVGLLRGIAQVTPNVLAELPVWAAALAEPEQLALLGALQGIASRPERANLHAEHLARLTSGLDDLASDGTDAVQAQILCLYGAVRPATVGSLADLVDVARAGLHSTEAGAAARAVGAAHGVGRLLARLEQAGDADDAEAIASVVGRFRPLALTNDEELAAATIAALHAAGRDDLLLGTAETGEIEAVTLLLGFLGATDAFVVDDTQRRRIRQLSEFIRHPPGLSGADAARHADLLTEHLLCRAGARMRLPDEARRAAWTPMSQAKDLGYLLWALAELAAAQPVLLRAAVEAGHRSFEQQLIDACASGGDWLTRQNAARLLIFLGTGSGDTVRAILDAAMDTDIVRSVVLQELRWFDRVREEGFALLVDAVDDVHLSRCHFAVEILASLLEHEVLDDERHAAALRAMQRSLKRADATQPLLAEHDGRIVTVGRFADATRATLARLMARDHRPTDGSDRSLLRLDSHDADGRPFQLVISASPAEPGLPVLHYQDRYFRQVEDRELPVGLINAIANAATVARRSGIDLDELLEQIQT